MAGVYRPRHPERTVLYRVLFHHFERFVAEYEERFERTYGYFRPIVKAVVEKYLDCGNPRCGFALMNRSGFMRTAKRCPDPLSTLPGGASPNLLLQDPRILSLLPCQAVGGMGRVDAAGVFHRISRIDERETMDYLEFIARVTSHIPDKGQVMVRYYSLYANAHRGKVRKAGVSPLVLRMAEDDLKPVPSKGWAALIRKPHRGLRSAAMIRKVYEVDPLICPKCGSLAVLMEQRQRLHECGQMKVIAFLTDYQAVDCIIDHLKLVFVAEKPPPSGVFEQVALIEAEERAEYF